MLWQKLTIQLRLPELVNRRCCCCWRPVVVFCCCSSCSFSCFCPLPGTEGKGVGERRNFVKFNCNAYNKELGIGLGIKVAPTFFLYKNNVKVTPSSVSSSRLMDILGRSVCLTSALGKRPLASSLELSFGGFLQQLLAPFSGNLQAHLALVLMEAVNSLEAFS